MNPELEARLRRFGARVDAAAEQAAARHGVVPLRPPAEGERAAIVPDLEPVVVPLRRPARWYRALAVSAAAAAVAVALGVVVARTATDGGDRPSVAGSEAAAASSSEPASGPATTAPVPPGPPPTAAVATSSTRTSSTAAASATTTAPTGTPAAAATSTTAPDSVQAPVTAPPVCPSYRINESLPLRLCDRGEMVRQVQQRLRETVAPTLLADGFFGPATEAAVLEFQQQHGLAVDGLAGPDTVSALFAGAVAAAEV